MASRPCTMLAMLLLAAAPAWSAPESLPIVDEAVAARWPLATPRLLPPYPAELAGRGEPACVALGYRVDRDGRTSDFAVLRAWTPRVGRESGVGARLRLFARNSAAAVTHWRFAVPAERMAWPAYTAATFVYLRGTADAETVRRHCRVGDLAAFVARAQAARGSLMLGRMDRKQQTDPAMIPYDKHDWFDGMFGPGD